MSSRIVSRFVFALSLVFALAVITGCIEKKPQQTSKRESPVTGRLNEMVSDMSYMTSSGTLTPAEQTRVLKTYREEIYDFIAQALIRDPEELHQAAVILQQATGPEYTEAYLLAHHLAMRAVDKGYDQSRFLAAVSLDRYLAFSGQKQKYGTQYYTDSTGQMTIIPYDESITDEQRAEWNVAPLAQLKKSLERSLNPESTESSMPEE